MEEMHYFNGIAVLFTTGCDKSQVQHLDLWDAAEIVLGVDPAFGMRVLKCSVRMTVAPFMGMGTDL